MQSTDETPQGALTLRVYAGDDCRGSLYTDDGKSYAYQRGNFLRMDFTCTLDRGGMQLSISKHQGNFIPWWKEFHIEIYGWKPAQSNIMQDGSETNLALKQKENHFDVALPDTGNGTVLSLR